MDATPSPSRRGLKPEIFRFPVCCVPGCNTVPIEKGTETRLERYRRPERHRCNTVPIEKGTETSEQVTPELSQERCNTVPIEKGTETLNCNPYREQDREMQHRPHREGD